MLYPGRTSYGIEMRDENQANKEMNYALSYPITQVDIPPERYRSD
jgi:hypothetical protein